MEETQADHSPDATGPAQLGNTGEYSAGRIHDYRDLATKDFTKTKTRPVEEEAIMRTGGTRPCFCFVCVSVLLCLVSCCVYWREVRYSGLSTL